MGLSYPQWVSPDVILGRYYSIPVSRMNWRKNFAKRAEVRIGINVLVVHGVFDRKTTCTFRCKITLGPSFVHNTMHEITIEFNHHIILY